MRTELLFHNFLIGVTILMQLEKNILSNHSLLLSSGSTKVIKIAIEPIVNLFMDLIVVITNFFWSFLFLDGFSFSGCSILICTANIDTIVAS
jgi:hypothetical protein